MRPAEFDDGAAEAPRDRPHVLDAAAREPPLADGGLRRLRVVQGSAAPCPLCGSQGESTGLFRGVYMCLADGCSVWTYEVSAEVDRPRADN